MVIEMEKHAYFVFNRFTIRSHFRTKQVKKLHISDHTYRLLPPSPELQNDLLEHQTPVSSEAGVIKFIR